MSNAQLIGMQKVHAASKINETMTAVEMCLAGGPGHGNVASLKDGRRFGWVESTQTWVRYE